MCRKWYINQMNDYMIKRVTLFLGHYGSGKTNIAVNFAIWLHSLGREVSIADLDIVNPYFRTEDFKKELTDAGVELVSMPFANTNVDIPALPSRVYGVLQDRSRHAVFDIGGDDRGAYALGQYKPFLDEEMDYDMLFVANFRRPLTATPGEALESMREIEAACGLTFTGIVNNTNLGAETTAELVEDSMAKADDLSRLAGVPLRFTSVRAELAEQILQNRKDAAIFAMSLNKSL